jgi:hypothetical protein
MNRNRIKGIIALFTLLFLLIGCGVEKEDINNITLLNDDETLPNKNAKTAKYDLSQYILPSQSQQNIYEITKYDCSIDINNSTKILVIDNKYIDYLIENNTTTVGYNTEYMVDKFYINKREFVDDNYDYRRYARYVDIEDYYYIFENVDIDSTYSLYGFNKCKVIDHNSSRVVLGKEYKDVLHLSCQAKFSEEIIGDFKEIIIFYVDYYYSKGIGQIQLFSTRIVDSNFKKTFYKSCIQEDRILKENSLL